MERSGIDKKSIVIIVISSLLFIMLATSIIFLILFLKGTEKGFYLIKVEEVLIKHDNVKCEGSILGYTGNQTKVVFPDSYSIVDGKVVSGVDYKLTSVAQNAFSKSSIVEVEFGANTQTILQSAFLGCESLKSIKATNLHTIGNFAFTDCKNLTDIEFYSTERISVGKFAFSGCESLKELSFSDYINKVEENAFSGCGFKKIELNKDVVKIADNAFTNCGSLETILLPDNLDVKYGKNLFIGCTNLKKIVTRGNVCVDKLINSYSDGIIFDTIEIYNDEEVIKAGSFNNFAKIKKLILPKTITQIQNESFLNVEVVEELVTPAVYEFEYDFEGIKKIGLLKLTTSSLDSQIRMNFAFMTDIEVENIILDEGVTKVCENAFCGIERIERLILPASLQEIASSAFSGCEIARVEIKSGVLNCLNGFDTQKVGGVYVDENSIAAYKEKYSSFADKFSALIN